jgi:hypothetical protein
MTNRTGWAVFSVGMFLWGALFGAALMTLVCVYGGA